MICRSNIFGNDSRRGVINPSSLTKFRKLRLKDTDLLNLLIGKTVTIAIEKRDYQIKIYYCRCYAHFIAKQPFPRSKY